MDEFYVRKNCRLCGSSELELVLPLQKSPLCGAYIKEIIEQDFYGLDVFLCKNCRFVQISTIINPKYIYESYPEEQISNGQVPIYPPTSGHSRGLKEHFEQYAEDIVNYLHINKSNFIIDIGSSSGLFLNYLKDNCRKVLGIEASIQKANEATTNGIETLSAFFDKTLAKKILNQYGHADIVTINNLIANIDDLENFTKGLEILLAENGVLVIESSYLLDMINNMVFDFIYHEHLSYFSIIPLTKFFKRFGMSLIRIQEVPTKGGSLRYFWAKEDSKWKIDQSVERLIEKERKSNINVNTFEEFRVRIDSVKEQLICFLQSQGNRKIAGYGASATSTTLISHFQLNQYITYLVDDNPAKVGKCSPGYHLPVYSSSKVLDDPPDVIIILAWRFTEQILKKISGIQSRVIVPLPKFGVLKL